MKHKHFKSLALVVALGAAFPQAALACRWYDLSCQAREEEQRLEREAAQALEDSRAEAEELLRQAEAEARRLDLPGVSAEINAIWHSAENVEMFAANLARHIESSLRNESGLLLSDISGMMKGLTLEQIMPKEVLDHLQTAQVPGSPLNQHIHKMRARFRRADMGDGTIAPVRAPIYSDSPGVAPNTHVATQTQTSSSDPGIAVGEVGNKYTFTLLPGISAVIPFSEIAKKPYRAAPQFTPGWVYAVPDMSISVAFPLLQIKQHIQRMDEFGNSADLKTPHADRFPVKMTVGLVKSLDSVLPDSLKESLDLNAGAALKFGVAMTCLSHPSGSCRIDNFSLTGQVKAGVDTLLAAKKAYQQVQSALTMARNVLGEVIPDVEPLLDPEVLEVVRQFEPNSTLSRILESTPSMPGIAETVMGDVQLVVDGAMEAELSEAITLSTGAIEEVGPTVQSILDEMINTLEGIVPEEGRLMMAEDLRSMVAPLQEAGDLTVQMLEETAPLVTNAAQVAAQGDGTAALVDAVAQPSFCEKVSWQALVGNWNTSCALESKLDLSFGLVWRNEYTTYDDNNWVNGYKYHSSPDVFKIVFNAREVAGVEFGYRDVGSIKGRVSALFSEAFVYTALTTLGATTAGSGNEDESD